MVDDGTRKTLSAIPLLKTKAGPREKELWVQRLKEEYVSLIKVSPTVAYPPPPPPTNIWPLQSFRVAGLGLVDLSILLSAWSAFFCQYVEKNKEEDNDWFRLESNKEGTRWFGKCWLVHEMHKYEFDVEFDVSLNYTNVFTPISFRPHSCILFVCCLLFRFQLRTQRLHQRLPCQSWTGRPPRCSVVARFASLTTSSRSGAATCPGLVLRTPWL